MEKTNHIDLSAIIKDINQFSEDRDWDQFHSVKNLSMALNVEAGELMELFQWMKEDETNRVSENPVLLEKLQDEVADVFIYLMRIVSKSGINLEDSVRNKMQKNAIKYPVTLSKGNSRKYTEF